MSWKKELKENVTTLEELKSYITLKNEETELLEKIIDNYPMSIPKYYLSLINKEDPKDPIRKMCVPSSEEIDLSGDFDTSGELQNTIIEGLQHKYPQTALILSTNRCAMYCRHCFRKRLVGQSDEEIAKIFHNILSYISDHKEITNVLITGGDAFLNNNKMLEYYLKNLSEIEHIKLIRFGSRVPVVLPSRIYEDEELLSILENYSKKKAIYLVTQFNHPRELTAESKKAIDALLLRGVITSNQTVLLKGINDSPEVLSKLLNGLNEFKIIPYYVFQCRPVSSVKTQFQVPILKSYDIIEEAKTKLNGHGKRFKFVMSHETGKIEILGPLKENKMLFKYHQAKNISDNGRIFIESLEKNQCWLD